MNIKVGYKVFKGKKVLKPATENALQRIKYYIGRWNKQDKEEFGPFAVFETIESAKKFMEEGYGNQIRKVEYIQSNEYLLWKKNPPFFSRNIYSKGYRANSSGISVKYLQDCPENTVLAEEIYVTEEIL